MAEIIVPLRLEAKKTSLVVLAFTLPSEAEFSKIFLSQSTNDRILDLYTGLSLCLHVVYHSLHVRFNLYFQKDKMCADSLMQPATDATNQSSSLMFCIVTKGEKTPSFLGAS